MTSDRLLVQSAGLLTASGLDVALSRDERNIFLWAAAPVEAVPPTLVASATASDSGAWSLDYLVIFSPQRLRTTSVAHATYLIQKYAATFRYRSQPPGRATP